MEPHLAYIEDMLALCSHMAEGDKIYRAKDFLMYDYGSSENKKRYGQVKTPAYDVDRVKAKVALFSSEGDTVADPEDVSLLVERLGSNLLFHHVVEPTYFRHLDFCWGYRANDIVHNMMLDTLEKYSGTST
nr:gastric triacylglycerol lipase-like [Rhipicephalus microplus]